MILCCIYFFLTAAPPTKKKRRKGPCPPDPPDGIINLSDNTMLYIYIFHITAVGKDLSEGEIGNHLSHNTCCIYFFFI